MSTTQRRIKIEESGNPWKRLLKPKIRLSGKWLEQSGFVIGHHVQVISKAPGHLELILLKS